MSVTLLTRVGIPIVISILLFAYAGYCWVNQKVHVRGKGWKTKDEAPKTFYFTVILLVIIGLGQIVNTLFWFLK
ncbi:MAG TPA: hypothetical protein QF401_01655 [Candidatus Poseidoniaceae archaeon]|nr:hypothetical protein [Candidatus Poseidoniaceae archaeon]